MDNCNFFEKIKNKKIKKRSLTQRFEGKGYQYKKKKNETVLYFLFVLFSPHHCPCLKGQSRGRPDPAPNPQSPGTGTHPLQHCFQLQGVEGRGEMLNKVKINK